MNYAKTFPTLTLASVLFSGDLMLASPETGPANQPVPVYHIYAGTTHSHTSNTWSHGVQWGGPISEEGEQKGKKQGLNMTPDGVSHAPKNRALKPNWQKLQGPPSAHFALAKASGYDFYVTTDHSQEETFHPTSPTNPAWVAAKRDAAAATDSTFVALAAYEHSENNGPGGKGHLNVINSAEYLNALEKGIDLPYLYKWLKTVPPNGEGPVVVSFNHPGPHNYNDFAYRDPEVTDIITMLEVINSNKYKKSHYDAFLAALDKGWKVSPVAGHDNHGFGGIKQYASRTFVLATNKTKVAILDAMKHRRTYAALDKNIQCRYTVNGAIMGSTLPATNVFNFRIAISEPDTGKAKDKITKIDIVKDGGKVVQSYEPTPDYSVTWSPTVTDATSKYFFVRVWRAGGGDTPEADPQIPVAWLAPVWTGR
ncbi:MAG TPA: hypothetical protein VMU04_23125 [Candidatus Acidoferrum sp.]|nr:hypothetical protein [Candidatus Acidoferrum sp.]